MNTIPRSNKCRSTPVDLRRMAFELSNGQLRQGLRHLDEDLLAALDEPRPNWDVELRVRDDNNGYGLFSGIWGEPPSRARSKVLGKWLGVGERL